ncbi:MAG: START domain-containing protein [Cocleimonas sp.]
MMIFKTTLLLFIISLVGTLLAAPVIKTDNKWHLIRQADDIQVYTRFQKNKRIKSAKGVVIIATKMDELLAILEDIKRLPQWLYQCKYAKTLEQINIVERNDYIYTNIPWLGWDRDVVVHSVFRQNKQTKEVEISFDSLPDKVALKARVVRIRTMTGRLLLTPLEDNRIKVIYEVNADPGGKIPKWMVNEMVSDFPFYSLQRLRELVKKQSLKTGFTH